jgi:hypothetical protein
MAKDQRRGFVGKLLRTISVALGALALISLVVLALAIGIARYGDRIWWLSPLLGQPTRTSSTVIVEDIQRLNELATVKWTTQAIIEEEGSGALGQRYLPEFLTGEEVLLIAVGEVRAGVNLDELAEDDVRVDGKRVSVDLPDARVLSTSLQEEKTRLYNRERGWLRFRGDDRIIEEARRDAVEEIRNATEGNGIQEQAQTNAEDSIRTFLEKLGYEEVTFE